MSEAPTEHPETEAPTEEAPGRLHISSVFFRLGPHVRGLIVPGVVLLFASSSGGWQSWQVWLMLLIVPSTIYEVIQYLTFRYRLRGGELLVTSGLVFKRSRHIGVDRIHSVDLKQGPVHRMLGVAEVKIETAGGSEPEATLRVLRLGDVEALRASLRRAQSAQPGIESAETSAEQAPEIGRESEREILRLGVPELVKLGLVSMRGAAIAAVLVGLAWEMGLFKRIDLRDRIEAIAETAPAWQLAFVGGVIAMSVGLLLVFLSVSWTVVRLYGFRLVEVGENLRLTCGLLTRLTATVPRRRIQLVSVIQTPIHRYFGRVSIRVETASGSADGEQKKVIGQRWFVPILPAERVPEILARIAPRVHLDELDWRPLAPGATGRAVKLALVSALSLGLVVMLFSRPWGLALLPALVVFFCVSEWLDIRRTTWALFDGGIAYRHGVLSRSTTVTFFDKVQTVSVEESPFDRSRGMATLDVDTAGAGASGQRIRIKYLERSTADELYRSLSGQAALTDLRW